MSRLLEITRNYLLFSTFCCFWVANDACGQLLVGPTAGVQLNWLNFEDEVTTLESESVVGFNGGLMVVFKVGERYFLQTEYLYSREGKRYEGVRDPQLDFKMVNHHFELPIIYRVDFKAAFANIPEFKYYLGLGPNISYWWMSNGTISTAELSEFGIPELEYDVTFGAEDNPAFDELVIDKPNRIQLGVNFAAGLVFQPASGHVIVVDLRYQLGHSFWARSDFGRFAEVQDFADPMRSRLNGVRLGVSYLFDTKIAERKKGKSTYKVKKR